MSPSALTDGLPVFGDSAPARLRELYGTLAAALRPEPDKPEETPAATLAALCHLAAGSRYSVATAAALPPPVLDDAALTRLAALCECRLAGVPLAHLTERQRFMGIEMLAGPAALIPRCETELLAGTALELLDSAAPDPAAAVADACTGSGNVAIALARHRPDVRVWCADLSAEAAQLAEANMRHCGVADRVRVLVGDLLAPFDAAGLRGAVALLTCNPPYISSAKVDEATTSLAAHEPRLAFDGGPIGLAIVQRLVIAAPEYLRRGGWLVFEVGAGQGRVLAARVGRVGAYAEVRPVADAHGQIRVIAARRA